MLLFFVLVFPCVTPYNSCAYMTVRLHRKPVFTASQLERFANIFDNAGQVALGVMVLTTLVQGIDKTNIWVLRLGAIDVIAC